ncbi:MAG: formimidoylglutamate deiminase [Gammaproteobacteria bacterium]|nr:formimidoylglutamate deiminase [Gammaproteobacteria bacterium]
MSKIFAHKAFLTNGWNENVHLTIADGLVQTIQPDCQAEPRDFVADAIIPGIANAHSHAFQRALAGHCEHQGPEGKDNFWSWRVQMYRLANLISPEDLTSVACQAYSEMLASGYTSVAEFHYLHRDSSDTKEVGRMSEAIFSAAEDTGIRLTYVPILYERAGFGQPGPLAEQGRFAMDVSEYIEHFESARARSSASTNIGVGAHSLRAVSQESLAKLADIAGREQCPLHIHIAEQTAEVEQCLMQHQARPVEWLFKEFAPNEHWCLVHATHVTSDELESMARSNAIVCLCPTTEANLGDGIFPLRDWLELEGHIAIGSDSHISLNPFEEMRWLEYGQRLSSLSRNVASVPHNHCGRNLLEKILEGGAQACGHGATGLQVGLPADLVVLDLDHPMLAGHTSESILDALVFSGLDLPISRVMVAGKWQVIDGLHVEHQGIGSEYSKVVDNLWIAA